MNLALLEEICQTPGAPGFEDRIRQVVIRELEPLVDDFHVDNMGNVIAHRRGAEGAKKLMLAAHMDEIGFVVRYVDDSGFIRLDPVTDSTSSCVIRRSAVRSCCPINRIDASDLIVEELVDNAWW